MMSACVLSMASCVVVPADISPTRFPMEAVSYTHLDVYKRQAQIQYVNSVIMGLAQYLQPSICSHAYHAIDRRVNNTALEMCIRDSPWGAV